MVRHFNFAAAVLAAFAVAGCGIKGPLVLPPTPPTAATPTPPAADAAAAPSARPAEPPR